MHNADYMPSQDVRLSVRLSHAGIESKRLHISSKFFSPSGSSTIPVFSYQTGWRYSDGDPPNGGVECKGVWKNHDFRQISRFISELMQDRAIVTMEGEWETAPKLSNGTGLNHLDWPPTKISRSWYHSTSNNSKTVQNRAIFTMRTNRKSYIVYRTAPFSMILTTPNPVFKVTLYFDAEYLING